MKFVSGGLAMAAMLGVAACSNPNRPTDTGNMAFPAPVPAGVVGTSRPNSLDTGSMNLPNESGLSRTTPASDDTGSMALPGRAQGNAGTTRRR